MKPISRAVEFGEVRLEIDRSHRFAVEHDLTKQHQLSAPNTAWSGCTGGGVNGSRKSLRE